MLMGDGVVRVITFVVFRLKYVKKYYVTRNEERNNRCCWHFEKHVSTKPSPSSLLLFNVSSFGGILMMDTRMGYCWKPTHATSSTKEFFVKRGRFSGGSFWQWGAGKKSNKDIQSGLKDNVVSKNLKPVLWQRRVPTKMTRASRKSQAQSYVAPK